MARAMRAQGATYKQIRATLRVGSDTVTKLLGREGSRGGRPRIPKETRGQARELRHAGMTIPEISQELGLARSTAWQITKDIPWTPAYDTSSRQKDAARRRWDAYEEQRSLERDEARKVALEEIGALADRELMLIGAVLYWAEGTKSKPWSRREQLQFINSDPDVVRLYLGWLRLLGVPRERISFRVNIHESADVTAAERYWAEAVGISPDDLQRTTLKRHVAKTVRKNTGIDYHGCLAVRVRQSVREYWYMEDLWVAIVRSIGCESAAGVREDNP
jgi:hypothetical protein